MITPNGLIYQIYNISIRRVGLKLRPVAALTSVVRQSGLIAVLVVYTIDRLKQFKYSC